MSRAARGFNYREHHGPLCWSTARPIRQSLKRKRDQHLSGTPKTEPGFREDNTCTGSGLHHKVNLWPVRWQYPSLRPGAPYNTYSSAVTHNRKSGAVTDHASSRACCEPSSTNASSLTPGRIGNTR